MDLQKAFDIVHHKILLHKLQYYGIWGICYDWFNSYLSDCKQFFSINGYNFDLMPVDCGVQQSSILGSLLFLININYLHKQFNTAKDITLLIIQIFFISKSVKILNKLVNHDMKHLNNWLRANNFSLNVEKTELVIFKSPSKVLLDEIKIKLSGKRLNPSNSVKLKIDRFLHWHD